MNDHGANPLGNGQWQLVPSGRIVDKAGLDQWRKDRKSRHVQNDCLGLSWDEIEAKQGGKIKRNA